MKLRVCVAGATGWVGKPLCVAVSRADDLSLVGAVSRSYQGRSLKDAVGEAGLDLRVSGSVAEALDAPTDVLVAIGRGVHVVIGSSGLDEDDFAEIERAAVGQRVGVVAAGNFAVTAVLLQRFACEAAKYLSHWEVLDYASDAKQDAPSGTARELAFRLSEVGRPETTHPVEETIGEPRSRGAALAGTQVHSIRLPGYVIGVEALFGAADERLSIRHDAGSGAGPYIQGTLLAIRKVRGRVGLVRGLDRIMD
jgi:4-hydroxy-tetrahydrodipicolinate reductase